MSRTEFMVASHCWTTAMPWPRRPRSFTGFMTMPHCPSGNHFVEARKRAETCLIDWSPNSPRSDGRLKRRWKTTAPRCRPKIYVTLCCGAVSSHGSLPAPGLYACRAAAIITNRISTRQASLARHCIWRFPKAARTKPSIRLARAWTPTNRSET